MNYYTCNACLFTFASDSMPTRCPDCGKLEVQTTEEKFGRTAVHTWPAVRPATLSEIDYHLKVKNEIDMEEGTAQEMEAQARICC
ncbi:MAG: hypothetical protein J6A79_12475 [Clostridia bacterium]|nr:hypothetical protein [Clostridia bacterium]